MHHCAWLQLQALCKQLFDKMFVISRIVKGEAYDICGLTNADF